MVKRLSTMQETWVPSLGREDPLEDEMAAHASILAWRISWTEEPGGLQSMGSQELDMTWRPKHHRHRLHSKQYSVERMGQMHGDCRVPEESFSEVSSVSREVASFSVIL